MNPQIGFFLSNAVQYLQSGNLKMAEKFLNQAHALDRKNIDVLRLLGVLAAQQKRLNDAAQLFQSVIKLSPKNGIAYSNLGNVFLEQKEFNKALEAYEKAIALQPNYAEAHNNRGNVLQKLMQFSEAIDSYNQAIKLDPQCAQFYSNRANALKEIELYDEALASYQQAINLNPQNDETWGNLGNMLYKLKFYKKALECYKNAVNFKTDSPWAYGLMLFNASCIFSYSDFDLQVTELNNRIDQGMEAIPPHPFLSLSDDPAAQKRTAEIWSKAWYPQPSTHNFAIENSGKKIRLAYFSSDFRTHPVSQLIIGPLENHDKTQFEIYCFSYGKHSHDEMTERIKIACDHFIDIGSLSDAEAAKVSQDHGIDIAIDLTGHTENGRPGIFCFRAAPIQINYLGYAGTMGMPCYDFILANEDLIPKEYEQFYSEKVIRFDGPYLSDDPKRVPSQQIFSRPSLGLPEVGFVFCCFNNSYKIQPSIVKSWATILGKVENSVLWISDNNEDFRQNIVDEFSKLGIKPERIIFAPRIDSPADHLARLKMADLFLDTHPYNAHTTAIDTLKVDVPILTLQGKTFAGRVASHLLQLLGLDELVTETTEEYIQKAIFLANNPQELSRLKQKIANHDLKSPAQATKAITSSMESAYLKMIASYQYGK